MSNFAAPDLDELRRNGRDFVLANLPVRSVLLPNSPLRVMSDNSAGLAFMVLLYLQNVADNLLPDRANIDWLTRWANIYLRDGPKSATFSLGSATLSGLDGTFVPAGSTFVVNVSSGALQLATTADATIGSGDTEVAIRALEAGSIGNLAAGVSISLATGIQGADGQAVIVGMSGGVDAEQVEDLRVRVLDRIQKPPMGGDADDYVAWALEVPGVTRAWCGPLEMGIGTVTLRFMCDDLRATADPLTDGFPLPEDIAAVQAHVDAKRPVTVKDFFVTAPIPEPIDYTVALSPDSASLRAATEVSVAAMLKAKAAPNHALNGVGQGAQDIYAAWVSDAVLNTAGIDYLDLTMDDHVMPNNGAMAVLGSVTYA